MNKNKRLVWGSIFGTTLFWAFAVFVAVGFLKHKGYHLVAFSQEPDPLLLEGRDLWKLLDQPEYVADASMSQDGMLITVNLKRTDRAFKNWSTYRSYKKGDPYYDEIISRLEGLNSGETKNLKGGPRKESQMIPLEPASISQ